MKRIIIISLFFLLFFPLFFVVNSTDSNSTDSADPNLNSLSSSSSSLYLEDHEDVTFEQENLYYTRWERIEWEAKSLHPDMGYIWVNNELVGSGEWGGGNITLYFNASSPLGIYNLTVKITDTFGNEAMDSVNIEIVDTQRPEFYYYWIDEYEVEVSVFEKNPRNWSLFRNGIKVQEGDLTKKKGPFSISLEIIFPWEKKVTYQLVVEDTSGNRSTLKCWREKSDIQYSQDLFEFFKACFLLVGGIGIGIWYYKKKKKEKERKNNQNK